MARGPDGNDPDMKAAAYLNQGSKLFATEPDSCMARFKKLLQKDSHPNRMVLNPCIKLSWRPDEKILKHLEAHRQPKIVSSVPAATPIKVIQAVLTCEELPFKLTDKQFQASYLH